MAKILHEVLIRGFDETTILGAHVVWQDGKDGPIGQAEPLAIGMDKNRARLDDVLGNILTMALATIDTRNAQITRLETELNELRSERDALAGRCGGYDQLLTRAANALELERAAAATALGAKEAEITRLRQTQSALPELKASIAEIRTLVERQIKPGVGNK